MINTQLALINYMRTKLRSISALKYVGIYPDNIIRVGQKFPAVIIMEGDEADGQAETGNCLSYIITVSIILITELRAGITRLQELTDLQTDIIELFMNDLSLGGYAQNIVSYYVTKGDSIGDIIDDGYQGEISMRKISFNIKIKTER